MADINLGLVAAVVVKEAPPPIHTEVIWGEITDPLYPNIVLLKWYKNGAWVPILEGLQLPWRETILHVNQLLNGGSGGIATALPLYLVNNAVNGDFITIKPNIGASETFVFKNSPGAGDIQIGASASITMDNMATTISAVSVLVNAVKATGLTSINSGSGEVIILHGVDNTAPGLRVYGTFSVQSDCKVVNYNNEATYDKSTASTLPLIDVGKMFGFNRQYADLVPIETHWLRSGSVKEYWFWNNDGQQWLKVVPFTSLHVSRSDGYIHVQTTPAAVWTVNHNLQKYPSVMVVDSAKSQVEGDVRWLNNNTVEIEFTAAFAGEAYLS